MILKELADNNVYKVNFAGGEPLLHPELPALIEETVRLGMRASLISNGSLFTRSFIQKTAPLLSQVGLSCDSLDDQVNSDIGRGFGNHVPIIARAFTRLHTHAPHVQKKLNTVVMRPTLNSDFSGFIQKYHIDRWKVFKILKIQGENDHIYDDISITDKEFSQFLSRHKSVKCLVPEDNNAMLGSYIMLDPEGRIYQNFSGVYKRGRPIQSIGLAASLSESGGFAEDKFHTRLGSYDLDFAIQDK